MRAHIKTCLTLTCALAFLAGCPTPTPAPEIKTPTIVSFSASPTDLPEGGSVTLKWETKDAVSVEINDSNRGAVSGAEEPTGESQVQVDQTTLFVLTAKGDDGRTTRAVAQVRAGPAASELVLVAQPSVVPVGGAVTLAWTATDARNLRLSTSEGEVIELGGQTASGVVTVNPAKDTTYVLEAGGRRAEASVKIRPEIVAFEANPKSAEPGQPLTLSWKTTGATKITLEEPDRGQLDASDVPARLAEGSFEFAVDKYVAKDRVFNFRLRAEGGTTGVVVEKLITVYVAGQSHILDFKAPRYGLSGGTFLLSWNTAEADQVVILAGGVEVYRSLDAAVAAAGSTALPTPAAHTTYELRATSARGGLATKTAEVSPVVKTALQEATATPDRIAQGGAPVSLSWKIAGARQVRIVHSADGTVFSGTSDQFEDASITVYPNATGTYEILADNTLGDSVSTKVQVTVDTPAKFGANQPGTIFQGETVTLSHPGPSSATTFVGFPHGEIDQVAGAADASFIDISETGARAKVVPPADKSSLVAAIDFETWLFGERVTGKVHAFTDGFFVIGPWAASKNDNLAIPGEGHERSLFAPFWDDLVFGADSSLLWEVRGDAPNRVLIVQWNEVQIKGDPESVLTFQAQVHQTGEVKFVYKRLLAPTATATIGVQGPVTARGLAFANTVKEGDVLTFFGARPTLTMTADLAGPYSAFIPVGDAYLRVPLAFDRFVSHGQLDIAELMPQPHATLGTAGEWIEVANVTNAEIDLAGWTLETTKGSHVITAGPGQQTVVAPGDVLVLGATKDTTANGGVQVDYAWGSALTLDDATSFVSIFRSGYSIDYSWASSIEGESQVRDAGRFVSKGDPAGTTPHGLTCVGTTLFGEPALAQKGSPGVLKGCFGYRMVERPVDFRDISFTSKPLMANSNINSTTVSLAGSGAKAFGAPVNDLFVSRHGFVVFNGSAVSDYKYGNTIGADVSVPATGTPDAAAAVFARYLNFAKAPNANVYLKRVAANEDPANPTGHWIVQWSRMQDEALDDLNFQLKVFDDGALEYHYAKMQSANADDTASGAKAVCWLEDPTGAHAQVISVLKPSIRPHTAFRFIPE